MKNKISKKIICLAAVAVMLLVGSSVSDALAYFTTYVVVEDTNTLPIGFTETEIAMTGDSAQKTITVTNTGDYGCFVRVKVMVPSGCGSIGSFSGEGWTEKDGYYEYSEELAAGAVTKALTVGIVEADDAADDYNVIAVQECAPVLYDDDGDTYVNWDATEFEIEKR